LTKEELAARLNGREYGNEMTAEEEGEAKTAGLVVLFGASDDLAELRGAINDEVGCYSGGDIVLLGGKPYEFEQCDCVHAEVADDEAREYGLKIEALWCDGDGYSWTYRTEIPHATFDVIEDGEPYCRGIVFSLPEAEAQVGL
jgi:hypothetical protein